MTKDAMWRDAERMTREQFCDKWGDEHGEFWDNIVGEMDEGSMADAEQHSEGPKFGGYWKGTDKNPPKSGQGVGGCEESVEECDTPMTLADKLRARWEETKRSKGLEEAGANNPAPGGMSTPTTTPAGTMNAGTGTNNTAQDAQKIKTNLQSLKSKVPGLDVNKATAALTQADANLPLNAQQNAALSKSLAGPIANVAKNPQLAGQLTQLINKGQQTATAQQKQQAQQQGGTQ
jgi:hypothetical protein